MNKICLSTPLMEESVRELQIGDIVYLSGAIFTARDMAHLKMTSMSANGEPLSKDLRGAALFHAGPVALKNADGEWRLNVIGPTTSIRMEPYAEFVGQLGVGAIIGKGGMAEDTLRCCAKYGYVYLQAAPGCAAQLALGIRKIASVTWLEMGMPEAVWELEAERFGPLTVAMDTHGHSIYNDLREKALAKLGIMYPVNSPAK